MSVEQLDFSKNPLESLKDSVMKKLGETLRIGALVGALGNIPFMKGLVDSLTGMFGLPSGEGPTQNQETFTQAPDRLENIPKTEIGNSLANNALRGNGGNGRSRGRCYEYAARAIINTFKSKGRNVHLAGMSAYMAAPLMANQPKHFREFQVAPKDLSRLPAGAVVVWGRGPGKPHGHISVALGDGREASDFTSRQIMNYPSRPRVFMPLDA